MLEFYKNKKVFITGHNGFKGTWLCKMLTMAGAKIYGFSLPEQSDSNFDFFRLSKISANVNSKYGDIRKFEALKTAFEEAQPEIVFHLAAQPLVIESYKNPHYTYETNVMGTVNLLECVRHSDCVKSLLNVTTDKVYENKEWCWGYRENEPLDGYDPYSNSKSCSELVTHSYNKSFFSNNGIAVSTARAGNVIGGGDMAADRIIPDCVRAAMQQKEIIVRNPYSIRPYQHVLEPLSAYLIIAEKQYNSVSFADSYNVGPDNCDCVSTGELVDIFCKKWGNGQNWKNIANDGPHEAKFLKLDCSKIKTALQWAPRWHVEDAVEKTAEWFKCYAANGDVSALMEKQINEFMNTGAK